MSYEGESDARQDVEQRIKAVELSMKITESAIERECSSLEHDRFGRRTLEMPRNLRQLYERSEWRNHNVYLWPTILRISQDGHARAAIAHNELRRLHYRPPVPIASHPVQPEAVIKTAKEAVDRISLSVKKVIASRSKQRSLHRKKLARRYMELRRAWIRGLEAEKAAMTEEQKNASRRRDREVLMTTRSSSGNGNQITPREVDLIFDEIEEAGGTAGGLERWSRSITGIPDHCPDYLPPASDGGMLIDDPLAYHYSSRYINPWTRTEIFLFLDKFTAHGKNFRRIASFFKHKTVEDVVRFYFDNKVRLNLKQLAKEGGIRKRGSKRTYLQRLSELPSESRSIKDNFMYQKHVLSDSDNDEDSQVLQTEKITQGASGRGWTATDRQTLIFALCRFHVTDEDESKPVSTLWSQIASAVGSKTPRQCRQFYFQYKTALALDSYKPPTLRKRNLTITLGSTDEQSGKPHYQGEVLVHERIENATAI